MFVLLACLLVSLELCSRSYYPWKDGLFPTWQWQVQVGTHTGESIPSKIYKKFGRNLFFLCVEWGEDEGWSTMEFCEDGKVHVSAAEHPYWYYISGGHSGRNILDPMSKERWHLAYTNKSVVFSNDVYSVSAKRRGLFFRTTPEVHRSTGDGRKKNGNEHGDNRL